MSRRSSKEGQIVSYFETAPIATAEVVFGIVQATVRRRREATSTGETKCTVSRKTRKSTVKPNAKEQPSAAASPASVS